VTQRLKEPKLGIKKKLPPLAAGNLAQLSFRLTCLHQTQDPDNLLPVSRGPISLMAQLNPHSMLTGDDTDLIVISKLIHWQESFDYAPGYIPQILNIPTNDFSAKQCFFAFSQPAQ